MTHVRVYRVECRVCGRKVRANKGRAQGNLFPQNVMVMVEHNGLDGRTCPGGLTRARLLDTVIWPVAPVPTIKEIYDDATRP